MSQGQRITEESGCTVLTTCSRVLGLSPTTGPPSIRGQCSKPRGVLEETVWTGKGSYHLAGVPWASFLLLLNSEKGLPRCGSLTLCSI